MLGPRALHELLGYWTEQLAGAPPHAGAARRPTAARACRATAARVLEFELPGDPGGGRCGDNARAHGVSLFVHPAGCLRHADRALHRGARTSFWAYRSPVATTRRRRPLIGFFSNTLALRTDASGDPTFSELVDRVKTAVVQAQVHQELPFEKLVEVLNPERTGSHSPIFQLMFGFDVPDGSTTDRWAAQPVEMLSLPRPALRPRGLHTGDAPASGRLPASGFGSPTPRDLFEGWRRSTG